MRYVVVEARSAQETIKRLREAGVMENGFRVLREGGRVLVPVSADVPVRLPGILDTVEKDGDPSAPRPKTYRELVDLPENVKLKLPRSFDVVGDVAILKLESEVEAYAQDIANALTRWNPAIRRVALDSGVSGDLRVRELRLLIGGDLITSHQENGLRFRLDLASVYFSPRLSGERLRLAAQVRPGERVLDMFAGVGPFAVLIAKRRPDCEVVAVDANPAACWFLRENARSNGVSVDLREGRIEDVAPTLGRFDRIIMNLPRSAEDYFPLALSLLRPGAPEDTRHVHLYTVADERSGPESEIGQKMRGLKAAGSAAGVSVHPEAEQLKTFATRVWIWRIDVKVSSLPDSPIG
ncbi:MAG TPA: class I SAM-dependent methyltransferase family protein [Thermoplasmata archaeon]|nr:class I SAM-dependent methyltransferase family protein [Thermoplasmata archaeon]